MRKCPNSNPEFNKMFDSLTGSHTPETRRFLYYGVCIPLRLWIYLLLWKYRNSKALLAAVALVSLGTIIRKVPGMYKSKTQWWSQQFQVAISVLMLIASVAVWMGKADPSIISTIWLISIIGGLIQSVIHPIC